MARVRVRARQGDRVRDEESSALSIRRVRSRADLSRFIELPRRLYAGDPVWIAPLAAEQRSRFSPDSHYAQHARWQAWLAERHGQVVGRITAQIDSLETDTALGYFGMLEAEDEDVLRALLRAAGDWLRAGGMQRVRGPLNLHINEEIGLLVDGFDTPPSVMMGHALPWYGDALERAGFSPARDLLAYRVRPDFEAPPVMTRLARKLGGRVSVRSLRRRHLASEADTLRELFNDAWADNWGFVPLDAGEWRHTVKSLAKLLPDEYIQIAEVDGEPAAFIVALPNINEAARDLNGRLLPFGWARLLWRLKVGHPRSARVPLMGVRRVYQHSRMGPALAFMVIDAVRRALHARGVTEVEMSWILEDNDGMRNIIETIGGDAYKRYRVYEKDL